MAKIPVTGWIKLLPSRLHTPLRSLSESLRRQASSTVAILALILLLGLSGCATEPSVPVSNAASPEAAGREVVLLDEDMDQYVAVDSVMSTRNPNGYLVVQANIRNRADRDFTIQAQTLFYDRNGMILNSETGNEAPCSTIPLAANSTYPYKVQALSPAAQRFTIRLQYLGRKRMD